MKNERVENRVKKATLGIRAKFGRLMALTFFKMSQEKDRQVGYATSEQLYNKSIPADRDIRPARRC